MKQALLETYLLLIQSHQPVSAQCGQCLLRIKAKLVAVLTCGMMLTLPFRFFSFLDQLSITPDSRQSNLFTYNLFLKKAPSGGNLQYITVPQKKRIFTTQSLKLKMFRSNIC